MEKDQKAIVHRGVGFSGGFCGGICFWDMASVINSLSGIERMLSFYGSLSDVRIFWSSLLGLIGIPLEGLCYFGIYRLMAAWISIGNIWMFAGLLLTMKQAKRGSGA